ncbi:MAG: hypoxanthine phosphoribosyltransferase [Planctomycetales bacterium]|nr:hypoxanthine phosphoribosyltransferase [Planctomycetales bacterium]
MKRLLEPEQLQEGVAKMAASINEMYGHQPLTIVGIMTGSVMLIADLVRLLEMPLRVGIVLASSYRNSTVAGKLEISTDWLLGVRGHHLLLVDDIFDTGHTLVEVTRQIRELEPASLRSAVLLRKRARCAVEEQPDFVAFDIPDEFVVGYGLDYRDEYRNLPYLGALEPEDLARHEERES